MLALHWKDLRRVSIPAAIYVIVMIVNVAVEDVIFHVWPIIVVKMIIEMRWRGRMKDLRRRWLQVRGRMKLGCTIIGII